MHARISDRQAPYAGPRETDSEGGSGVGVRDARELPNLRGGLGSRNASLSSTRTCPQMGFSWIALIQNSKFSLDLHFSSRATDGRNMENMIRNSRKFTSPLISTKQYRNLPWRETWHLANYMACAKISILPNLASISFLGYCHIKRFARISTFNFPDSEIFPKISRALYISRISIPDLCMKASIDMLESSLAVSKKTNFIFHNLSMNGVE